MNDTPRTLLGWTVPSHIDCAEEDVMLALVCHRNHDGWPARREFPSNRFLRNDRSAGTFSGVAVFLAAHAHGVAPEWRPDDHAHGDVVEHREDDDYSDSDVRAKVECPDYHCAYSFRGETESDAVAQVWEHLRNLHGATADPENPPKPGQVVEPRESCPSCAGLGDVPCAHRPGQVVEHQPPGFGIDGRCCRAGATAYPRICPHHGHGRAGTVEHQPAADGAFLPCRGCAEDAKAARAELDALRAENERLQRDLKAMTRDREILYRDNCDGRDALDHYQAANERLQARIRAGLEARTADEMRAELLGMPATTPPDRSGRFVGDEFHPLTDLDGWQPTNREEPVNGD